MEHKYGLEKVWTYLWTCNYSWSVIPHKKVILVNVRDCKDKITLSGLIKELRGMGHLEWEALEAAWLIEAVLEAIAKDKETAEITRMFSCNLSCSRSSGEFFIKHEDCVDFLMERLFEKVDETDDELKVKLVKIV